MGAARKTSRKSNTPKSTAKKTSGARASARKTTRKATSTRRGAKKTAAKTPKAQAKKTSAKKTPTRSAQTKKTTTRRPAPAVRKRTTRPPRPAKLDAEALAQIRSRLTDERSDLGRQIEEIEQESFQGTQSDLTGEVGLDEDFADAGTATFDRERALSLQNNMRDLVDQISRAITRIDEGSYGTCERCGRPIDAARLKALPHALLCMDCKRREERAR
jgi:DnaK suppressor protein